MAEGKAGANLEMMRSLTGMAEGKAESSEEV